MSAGTVVWLSIGAIAAVIFFGIAAVVTIRGISELRMLLRRDERHP